MQGHEETHDTSQDGHRQGVLDYGEFLNHTVTSRFKQDQLLNQVSTTPSTISSRHPEGQMQRQVQRSH
eukprot:8602606-Prorocentrum_lima.AAC.1